MELCFLSCTRNGRLSSAFTSGIGGRFFTSELRNQNSEVETARKSFVCFLVGVSAFVCFLSGAITRKPFVCFLGGQRNCAWLA
jgi:hypothetical protein